MKSALVALRRVEAIVRELCDRCLRLDELAVTRSAFIVLDFLW
jgi:hypothetical protein